MKPALLMSLLWIGAVHASAGQSSITTPSSTEQELISIAQSLLDAVGEGDKSVWDRYPPSMRSGFSVRVDAGKSFSSLTARELPVDLF